MRVVHFADSKVAVLRPLVCALLGLGLPVYTVAQPVVVPVVQSVGHPQHFELEQVLGTSMSLWVVTDHPAEAIQTRQTILDEIHRLEALLSVWRPDSEISRLNETLAQHSVSLDPQLHSAELCAVIAACEHWQQQSQGAFNARIGQQLLSWAGQADSPTLAPLTQALTRPLQRQDDQLQIPQGIHWAPDALAKGYIIDQALSQARQQVKGLQGLMIDIGGDVRAWGRSPFGAGWLVGLQAQDSSADNAPTTQIVQLHDAALAMSGAGWRDQQGQSHLRDPHTGQSARHPRVAAIASTAQDADALATTLAVLSLEKAKQLVQKLNRQGQSVAAQIQDAQGHLHTLGDFESHLHAQTATKTPSGRADGLPSDGQWQPVATASAATFPSGYVASLGVNIPKITGGEYHAPYVAVWVTDAQKNLVRTLHVWGNKPKWMDSNYVWWRRYGRKLDNLATVAKPSRQPGQYQLDWDGLNDQGQRVPAGEYLIHIEAAREHGGHSYQTLPLTVSPQNQQAQLPARGELGELRLNYGPRT